MSKQDDKMLAVGFANVGTGGGCRAYWREAEGADRAWVQTLSDAMDVRSVDSSKVTQVLVAHTEGCWVPEELDEEALCCFYEQDDEIECAETTLAKVIAALSGASAPARSGTPDVDAELSEINRHRRALGMLPLDPAAAGWSDEDVVLEARRIRALNPRAKAREMLLAWR